jgi:hypothetical protein
VEIDQQVQDLVSKEADLPELERASVARLSKDLTSIRTIYRRDPNGSTFAMVVRFPFGMPKAGCLYELLIEITDPLVYGRPIWPFTLEEEMDLIEGNESWSVEQVVLNAKSPKSKPMTSTISLRRSPWRWFRSS